MCIYLVKANSAFVYRLGTSFFFSSPTVPLSGLFLFRNSAHRNGQVTLTASPDQCVELRVIECDGPHTWPRKAFGDGKLSLWNFSGLTQLGGLPIAEPAEGTSIFCIKKSASASQKNSHKMPYLNSNIWMFGKYGTYRFWKTSLKCSH